MKKILLGLALTIGAMIGATSTFAAPKCPQGTTFKCWYTGDIRAGDYSKACDCIRDRGPDGKPGER